MWNYSGNIATAGNFSQKSLQLNAIGEQTAQLTQRVNRPQRVFAILYPASLD